MGDQKPLTVHGSGGQCSELVPFGSFVTKMCFTGRKCDSNGHLVSH